MVFGSPMITQKNLTGKWIVQYHPNDFSPATVWEFLVDIQEWLNQKNIFQSNKKILIDKKIKKNVVFIKNRSLFFQIKNSQSLSIKKEYPRPQAINYMKFKRVTKKILLIYPVLLTDKRWSSIDLPTASLYLASSLTSQSFQVQVRKLVFPFNIIGDEVGQYDVIGITLYEDLFSEIQEYLTLLRKQYQGIIAAGGPMVTLNPLQTAFHLPQINLLIRGESEFIFPVLLKAIQKNDIKLLLENKGFFFHEPGKMIFSDFSDVNYPPDLRDLKINLDFLRKEHLTNGLELNISRGCRRGCLFCSKVQGKILRKIPQKIFETILKEHSEKIITFAVSSPSAKTINLNDDDILQDVEYAKKIFKQIQKHNYKIWGIQASINSFFIKNHQINREILNQVSNRNLFVNNNPVIWLGTDTFFKKRGKKIGKLIPAPEQLVELISEFEQRDISNFHYWISSDHNSDWEEFVREFQFLYELLSRFKKFGILAHSPFLIPYSTTPLYSKLIKNPVHKVQIKYRTILRSKKQTFEFPLVNRLETRFPNLNRLLNNEKPDGKNGFFDFLKNKKHVQALKTIYSFLRQDRISFESLQNHEQSRRLKKTESKLETLLSRFI